MINPVLKTACDIYGKTSQSMIAIEEMSELTKELSKNYRGEHNNNHIAEEIADVLIMMEQLMYLYNCASQVDTWKAYKIDRLKYNLENTNDKE